MANRSPSQPTLSNGTPDCVPPSGIPRFTEPEVRRWPHPVAGMPPVPCPLNSGSSFEDSCSQICCALSRQNQLLSEIKVLLEHLTADAEQHSGEK